MSPLLNMPIPVRQSLSDSVYEVVRDFISDGKLEAGARVSIDELARSLDVSSTPVREALVRLESDALVVREAHRGYAVAPLPDAAQLEHLYEIRRLLEPRAALLVARHTRDASSPELTVSLEESIEGMEKAMEESQGDVQRAKKLTSFALKDQEFHELIARAARNPFLYDAVLRLRPHMRLYRLYSKAGAAREAAPEHGEILRAIAAGDETGAEQAMAVHLTLSHERLRPWVSGSEPREP